MLWLALIPNVLALDWWVDAPEDAASLSGALDANWPGHAVSVHVGPGAGAGVWYAEGELMLVSEQDVRRQVTPADLALQVLLVRSWTAELQVDDGSWVPEPEPLPSLDIGLEPGPWQAAGAVGPGLRGSFANPPLHLAVELVRRGEHWAGGAVLGGHLLGVERLPWSEDLGGWRSARIGGGLLLGRYDEFALGGYEVAGLAQVRALSLGELDALSAAVVAILPSVAIRVRAWGPPRDVLSLGVGLIALVDGVPQQWDDTYSLPYVHTNDTVNPSNLSLHAEFCVAVRPRRSAR